MSNALVCEGGTVRRVVSNTQRCRHMVSHVGNGVHTNGQPPSRRMKWMNAYVLMPAVWGNAQDEIRLNSKRIPPASRMHCWQLWRVPRLRHTIITCSHHGNTSVLQRSVAQPRHKWQEGRGIMNKPQQQQQKATKAYINQTSRGRWQNKWV